MLRNLGDWRGRVMGDALGADGGVVLAAEAVGESAIARVTAGERG
jgi:hypothetical protein